MEKPGSGPWIAEVGPFDTPGTLSASLIRLISSSREMWSGVMRRRIDLAHSGAHEEYQGERPERTIRH